MATIDGDFEVDLESGVIGRVQGSGADLNSGAKSPAKGLLSKVCSAFANGTVNGDERANSCCNVSDVNGVSREHVKVEGEKAPDKVQKKVVKEKRKKTSNIKPPKPPRPPRGPSLDAADLKLIKEISELAMLRRAKIERAKALKKMKAMKTSSSSSISNLFALLFTILFCIVIIFQGISSRVTSANLKGSPASAVRTEGTLITVQYFGNPSASEPNELGSGSPSLLKPIAGSDPPGNLRRSLG